MKKLLSRIMTWVGMERRGTRKMLAPEILANQIVIGGQVHTFDSTEMGVEFWNDIARKQSGT